MESQGKSKLIWTVFYGLSALGKTYFLDSFKAECTSAGVKCVIVSSDDCSKIVMDKMMAKDSSLTQNQAFDKSRKEAGKLFEDTIAKAVRDMKSGNNIIVLDKVMNGGKFLKGLDSTFKPGCPTKLVALIPKTDKFQYSYHGVVPFSQSLIVNVLHRIINRADHQTVDGTDGKKAFLALSFVKLYNGMKSVTEKKQEGGIDEFFDISFSTDESPEKEKTIPTQFTELLKKTLKEIKAFQSNPEDCADLAEYVKRPEFVTDMKEVLGFGNSDQQKTQINKIIALFNSL